MENIPIDHLRIGSDNGFDHLLVSRGSGDELAQVVMFDSKQKSPSVRLSELASGDIQTSDGWILDVISRMKEPSNSAETRLLGNLLEDYIADEKQILKIVSVIDRSSEEVWILNLGFSEFN